LNGLQGSTAAKVGARGERRTLQKLLTSVCLFFSCREMRKFCGKRRSRGEFTNGKAKRKWGQEEDLRQE